MAYQSVRFTQTSMLNPNRRSTPFTATSLSLAALGLAIAPQAQAEDKAEPIESAPIQNQQLQPQPLAKAMALKTCRPCMASSNNPPETQPQIQAETQLKIQPGPIALNPEVSLTPSNRGLNLERIAPISDRRFLAKSSATATAPAFAPDWPLPEPIAHPPATPSPTAEANLRNLEARQLARVTGQDVPVTPVVRPSATPIEPKITPNTLSPESNLRRLEDLQTRRMTGVIAQAPDPRPIDPGTSAGTSSSIEDKLRRLEERQQQLVDEIEGLKTQLNAPAKATAQKPAPRLSRPQGFYGKAEVLMLKPGTTSSIDYAITDPLLGEFTATGGTLQKLDLDQQTNIRWGLGYRQHPWDIGFQTLSLKSSASGSAQKPIDGTLYPTLTSPLQNNNADSAKAKLNVRFTSSDLEAGYTLQPSDRFDLRLFSGLRIADTEQRFNVKYDGADFTNGEFQFKRNFSGIGPRLGAEARVNLGSGFSVFGRASGSLLIGSSKLKLRETNDSGAEVVASVSDRNQQQSIPVAEAALGMNWTQAIGKQAAINLGVGYEYQHWFNAFDNARFVDSQAPGAFQTNRGDINFGGLFIEAGVAAKF
jgi:hypothetical protein